MDEELESREVSSPGTTKRMLLELEDDPVRKFQDPIHDYLYFGPAICAVMDTPQFQRLREIKQLGTSYYVWPGASHNRFEHCLGVAYLAQTLATHLKTSQPSLGITRRDVLCVTIAGLCHDLGHGPWSHVWDSMFIPSILPDKKWCHEDASLMMFDALLEENGLEFDEDDALFVKAMIMGNPDMCKKKEKPYLFQIVANKTNGLDVDKFDYIARDSHAIDQRGSLSFTRLINSSRVIDDDICYDIKDANQIFELCHTRMSLHKRIYTHKTAKAIEFMIVDALVSAEPAMNIARRLEDPKKYLYLTDHIQSDIEASENPELEEAQKILHRIRTRDLYKAVDFKVFSWDQKAELKAMFTPESIVKAFNTVYTEDLTLHRPDVDALAKEFSPKHVIIDMTERHHGMKNENPLDFMKFYSKRHPDRGIHANEDDISVTLPRAFGELQLRIYTRDARFFGIAQRGYREVLKRLQARGAAGEGIFATDSADPAEEELDLEEPVHPVTPPADVPSTPKSTAQPPRALSRGHTRSLIRYASGVFVPLIGENQFTGVPPEFNPKESPGRKGRKREREKDGEKEKEKEKAETADEPLDLALMLGPSLETLGVLADGEGSAPPRKKSKPPIPASRRRFC